MKPVENVINSGFQGRLSRKKDKKCGLPEVNYGQKNIWKNESTATSPDLAVHQIVCVAVVIEVNG